MTRIKVRLKNGSEELLPHYVLDHYIKNRGIVAFERADGWVHIDRDPVRRKQPAEPFAGIRKRFTDHIVKKRFTDDLT